LGKAKPIARLTERGQISKLADERAIFSGMRNQMKALVVDDEAAIRDFVGEVLRTEGWDVQEAETAERAFELLDTDAWSLVFCDVMLGGADGFAVLRRFTKEQPDAQIVLMTGHGSAVGALDAVSLGAYDYLLKPFTVNDVLSLSRSVRERILSRREKGTTGELKPVYTSDIDLVGHSSAFVEVMKLVGRVAVTNLPVLITGESGTGKEVVARAIHRRSPRRDKPFVAVNCGAIPSELIESELFGHVRGSFTGATFDRRGLWEEADGGTVFLDEITETSLAFQVKLLRALQEGEIRRVGANRLLQVDVRVIAATNRDADLEVREGRFRQDLLYRLNAVTLHLPPLRERREDIRSLAKRFAERVNRPQGPPVKFTPEAMQILESYNWPGNIRELENAVVRAAALCDQVVTPDDLPERIRNFQQLQQRAATAQQAGTRTEEDWPSLSELEGRYVARVLAHTSGNKQAAARVLGVDRKTLQRMLKRHNQMNEPDAANSEGQPS
jgi:two-component system, NtrC family, response regulator AtoC